MKAVVHAFVKDTQLALSNAVLAVPARRIRMAFLTKILKWRIGADAAIGRSMVLTEVRGVRVTIGDRVNIGHHARMDGRGGVTIGSDVDMAAYVTFLSADHDPDCPDHTYRERGVSIGSNCWIATGATILPGTVLEDHVVLGARAVGHGTLKSGGIYVGNPATFLRERTPGAQARVRPYRRFWQ